MGDIFDVFDDDNFNYLGMREKMTWTGLRLAKVTNITDPDKKNRVKVRILAPEADKDILETDWCPVVMPLSGKNCGVFAMPSVDDIVMVAYLEGNLSCPHVIGGMWNTESPAPYTIQEGKNVNFSVKTPGGSELRFYDEKEKEYIMFTTPKKATLTVSDEKKTASFTDPEKKNSFTINWEKGEVELVADKKITLKSGKASIELDGSGKITVKADSSIELSSAGIKSNASNDNKISGSSVNVEAQGKLTLKGATADLKGSAGVNIN